MVRIKYIGDVNPCSVSAGSTKVKDWFTGEIKDFAEADAKKLIVQKYFVLVDSEELVAEPVAMEGDKEELVVEEIVEKVFDYKTALKDELLDFTADNDIEADYSMTVSELREIIEKFLENKDE